MNLPPDDLEKLIHRTLRELPPRRAPRTLEARVQAELERRAALPWWHRSYAYWPASVRAAFFVLSAGIAAGLVAVTFAMTRSPAAAQAVSEVDASFAWFELARAIAGSATSIVQSIPPLWLYGTLAVLGSCYATLVGVGAVAYRAFSAPR